MENDFFQRLIAQAVRRQMPEPLDPDEERERVLARASALPVSDLRPPQVGGGAFMGTTTGTAIDLAAKTIKTPTPSRPNRKDVAMDMDAIFDWREAIAFMRDVMHGKVRDPLQPDNPNAYCVPTISERMDAARFLKEARLGKAPASVEIQHNHTFDYDLSRYTESELEDLERLLEKAEQVSEGESLTRRTVRADFVEGEIVPEKD